MTIRFECVRDPSDRYQIWDNRYRLPVLHHGRFLSISTLRRAQRIAAILNAEIEPDPSYQPPNGRQPVSTGVSHGANRAQLAIRQHDPDNTADTPLARSLLCQQLVRRYRAGAGRLFTGSVTPFPSRGGAPDAAAAERTASDEPQRT